MAVKLRLQRHGRKGKPFYHLVAADSRARRDGKFIERVGFYDPNHDPAHIDVNIDRALYWLNNGAEPTNTARSVLAAAGVLYKKHLLRGLKKGALTAEQVESKFKTFMDERAKKDKVAMKVFIEPKATTQHRGMYTLPPREEVAAPAPKAEATPVADQPAE